MTPTLGANTREFCEHFSRAFVFRVYDVPLRLAYRWLYALNCWEKRGTIINFLLMAQPEIAANAVALKLPNFWTNQPETWFAQAEAQFSIRGITSDATKYYYVVAALDQDTAARLLDTLQNPPDADKYATLKAQLLKAYGFSRRERAAKLLDITSLGDRKPSVLLAEMRALSGGHTNCMLFEELFLRAMPHDIRLQLAEEDFADIDKLGARADALLHTKSQNSGIACNRIKVKRPTSNKEQTSIAEPNQPICFYHMKFGSKAQKCRQPCSYSGNAVAGRQ